MAFPWQSGRLGGKTFEEEQAERKAKLGPPEFHATMRAIAARLPRANSEIAPKVYMPGDSEMQGFFGFTSADVASREIDGYMTRLRKAIANHEEALALMEKVKANRW
jgi:hypothetical protein